MKYPLNSSTWKFHLPLTAAKRIQLVPLQTILYPQFITAAGKMVHTTPHPQHSEVLTLIGCGTCLHARKRNQNPNPDMHHMLDIVG